MHVSRDRSAITGKAGGLVAVAGLLIAFTTALLSGCAGTSTFTAHPKRINPLIQSIALRQPIDLNSCLVPESQSADLVLYNMERGRVAQIFGNHDVSRQAFDASIAGIRGLSEKAIISASDLGAGMASIAVNDNAMPYEGYGYERVLLHHYQALNYLSKHDLEGAGVEVRRANAEQEEARKIHEEDIERARKAAEEKHLDRLLDSPQLSIRYAQMDELAGKVKNSFQNAYTFYLSAVVYELLQQPNDAYIDYKKALEIYPDNSYLQQDVFRLAGALGMNEDLEELKGRFPYATDDRVPGDGDLIVFFEEGFVPQKQEVKIPLPIPEVGLLFASFPIYPDRYKPPAPLAIEGEGESLGSTEPICDIRALAVKALKEEIPVIATRQILRLVAKGATTKYAREKLGPFGELTATLWNVISESADLRSWVTLPADVQILRASLPPGDHRLALSHPMLQKEFHVDVPVVEGSKTILFVVRAGQQLYTTVLPFGTNTGGAHSEASRQGSQRGQAGRSGSFRRGGARFAG